MDAIQKKNNNHAPAQLRRDTILTKVVVFQLSAGREERKRGRDTGWRKNTYIIINQMLAAPGINQALTCESWHLSYINLILSP